MLPSPAAFVVPPERPFVGHTPAERRAAALANAAQLAAANPASAEQITVRTLRALAQNPPIPRPRP